MRASFVSKNRHKARELAVLLPGWEIEPTRAEALPEEVGETFSANARAKALFGRSPAALITPDGTAKLGHFARSLLALRRPK
jgi:inosine/xanthosine triphosphate pyrophosphatase family protein